MAELWETLTVGFVLSLLFIGVSYLFWRRYDRPTPLMVERAEEKARLREEQRTWREIEAKVRAEMAEAEEKAWLDRQRAEKAARAESPATATMSSAWASLGMGQPVEASTANDVASEQEAGRAAFLAERDDLNAAHRVQSGLGEVDVEDDDDLHAAPDLVQVRQDRGVTDGPEAPDWELVAKLEALANKEEVEVPDVPEAPDLDQLASKEGLGSPAETEVYVTVENDGALEHAVDGIGNVAAAEAEEAPTDGQPTKDTPPGDALADDTGSEANATDDTPAGDTPAGDTSIDDTVTEGNSAGQVDEGEAWGEDDGNDPWSAAAW
jgi:hypothetical protein